MTRCPGCGQRGGEGTFCAVCGTFLGWDDGTPRDPSMPPSPTALDLPAPRRAHASSLQPPSPQGGSVLAQALGCVEEGRRLALEQDRPDLAAHLADARGRVATRSVTVAVVGEFKRGKSTLVNALLHSDVCPVDADVVTAVPTYVRYGDEPRAVAYSQPEGETEPVEEPLDLAEIADYISDARFTGQPWPRSVEVRLPHRMLRSGLCLLDTPGVGGLDSAHGAATLRALDTAQAMLFVTEASQELTEPELAFLKEALERCPVAACVVTKTDLYPEWRRIVDIDRRHLRRAGIDLPVYAVSSFLRLRDRIDPGLTEESGYPELGRFLGATLKDEAARAAGAVAREVGFVADQLTVPLGAERAVLTRPAEVAGVVRKLSHATKQTARLASDDAGWQQSLTDGIQDLVADVEYGLQQRLRSLLKDVDAAIDEGDPRDEWDDTATWLRHQAVNLALVTYEDMMERADRLADDVAERFGLDAGTAVPWSLSSGHRPMDDIALMGREGLEAPGGRMSTAMVTFRSVAFVPALAHWAPASLLGVAVAGPLAVALITGLGRKVIRDERERHVAFRRQQAKYYARQFMSDVELVVQKDSRDELRQVQRQLRDEFRRRAAELHTTSTAALEVAQRAAAKPARDRAGRSRELDRTAQQVHRLQETVRSLAREVPQQDAQVRGA